MHVQVLLGLDVLLGYFLLLLEYLLLLLLPVESYLRLKSLSLVVCLTPYLLHKCVLIES